MTRILAALRSPGAMMLALVLALIAQGEHTAQVFAYFSHGAGSAQALSYAFAAAVEVAVLLFVLNGHKRISYLFAFATLCTNIVYYAIGGIDLQSVAVLPVLLLSALLPGVIVGYSHTIAETPHSTATETTQTDRWQWWLFWRKQPTGAPQPDTSAGGTAETLLARPVASRGQSSIIVTTSGDAAVASLPPAPTERPTNADAQGAQDSAVVDNAESRAHALQLAKGGKYTTAEIARMVDKPYNTVQSWLRRAQSAQNGGAH